jgi:hypothetical protein
VEIGTMVTKYYLGHQIKKNETCGSCGTYERGDAYRILVERREGEGTLGRCRRRWEDIIKRDFKMFHLPVLIRSKIYK